MRFGTKLPLAPLREIVRREDAQSPYTRPGEGSLILHLSCGHQKRVKMSKAPMRSARCGQCAYKK